MSFQFLPQLQAISGGETIHRLRMMVREFYAVAHEQCGRFFAREKIFVFERALPARSRMEARVEVDVRIAQSTDISKLAWKFGVRGMKEGISKRHLCFVAYMDGEIVHYKWVALNEAYVSELGRKMHFDSNSAYIYSSYTVPEYRGFGLDPKVTTEAFDYLHGKGIEKVYILVRHSNLPSLRALRKVGYRRMGEIRFSQLLGRKKYACEGVTEKDCGKIKEMFLLQ